MSRRILLIEDDAATRDSVRQVLEEHGHRVMTACDGEEALDLLRRAAPPDLVLLDLMMPLVDGWHFRLRQLEDKAIADVPVALLSANPLVAHHASAMHAVGYLRKPLAMEDLLALVERATKTTP